MKKSNGYLMKQLEDEWILLPVGEKTEAVHEVISLSETAGFIYERRSRDHRATGSVSGKRV